MVSLVKEHLTGAYFFQRTSHDDVVDLRSGQAIEKRNTKPRVLAQFEPDQVPQGDQFRVQQQRRQQQRDPDNDDGRDDAEIYRRYLADCGCSVLVTNRMLDCFDALPGKVVSGTIRTTGFGVNVDSAPLGSLPSATSTGW